MNDYPVLTALAYGPCPRHLGVIAQLRWENARRAARQLLQSVSPTEGHRHAC